MFAGNFTSRGWAFCQGQLLSIAQNTALLSLLETTYGGDGRTTFALPELRGSVPVGFGSGPGLAEYKLGDKTGAERITLTTAQLPAHMHNVENISTVNMKSPANDKSDIKVLVDGTSPGSTPNSTIKISYTGGSQPVSNVQPVLGMNYILALQGIYPSRS